MPVGWHTELSGTTLALLLFLSQDLEPTVWSTKIKKALHFVYAETEKMTTGSRRRLWVDILWELDTETKHRASHFYGRCSVVHSQKRKPIPILLHSRLKTFLDNSYISVIWSPQIIHIISPNNGNNTTHSNATCLQDFPNYLANCIKFCMMFTVLYVCVCLQYNNNLPLYWIWKNNNAFKIDNGQIYFIHILCKIPIVH